MVRYNHPFASDILTGVIQVLAWGPNIANIDLTNRGLGKHNSLSPFQHPQDPYGPTRRFFQNTYAFIILYILAITVAKFSM